jgi:hypothetical protein
MGTLIKMAELARGRGERDGANSIKILKLKIPMTNFMLAYVKTWIK